MLRFANMNVRRSILSGRLLRKVLLWSGLVVIMACVDSGDPDEMLSYFQPETSTVNPLLVHFHFSPDFVYHREGSWYGNDFREDPDSAIFYDDNLLAWRRYCNNEVTLREIRKVLFDTYQHIGHLLAPGTPLTVIPDSLPFIRYLVRHHDREALGYLQFAMSVDAGDTSAIRTTKKHWHNRPPERMPARRLTSLERLPIMAGENQFIRERYAFQVVKLASEFVSDSAAISFYNQFFNNDADTSVMKYWALSRVAGAHLRAGDTARALYEFAQVFDHSDSKKYAAYVSLRIHPMALHAGALALCKTPRERAAVYAISAIQPYVDALPMLKQMAADYPMNDLLELVMAREINKCEGGYFVARYSWFWYNAATDAADSAKSKLVHDSTFNYFDQLRRFALERTSDPRISDKAFWYTALAYMDYVRADYSQAEQHLNTAAEQPTLNPVVTDQIAIQRLMLAIAEQTHMTREFEARVVPMLAAIRPLDFRRANVFDASCRAISGLYLHQPPTIMRGGLGCSTTHVVNIAPDAPLAKAYLFKLMAGNTNSTSLALLTEQTEDTASAMLLDSTIAYLRFATSPEASSIDRTIESLAGKPLQVFYELRGRRAVNDWDYVTAASNFALIADSVWTKEPYHTYLAANPFWSGINETHVAVTADTVRYTPLTYARRMLELQQLSRSSDAAIAANANYLLGLGTFNVTPEGNSWLIASRNWSPAYVGWGYNDTYDVSDSPTILRAYNYFKHAASLEHDRENAARDIWMSARAEVVRYYAYLNDRWTEERKVEAKQKAPYGTRKNDSLDYLFLLEDHKLNRTSFSILKQQYGDTKFAQEVIAECSYYRWFVEGGQ